MSCACAGLVACMQIWGYVLCIMWHACNCESTSMRISSVTRCQSRNVIIAPIDRCYASTKAGHQCCNVVHFFGCKHALCIPIQPGNQGPGFLDLFSLVSCTGATTDFPHTSWLLLEHSVILIAIVEFHVIRTGCGVSSCPKSQFLTV